MTMLLAVDVGNSSIHIGIFTDSDLIASFRIPTWPDKPVFEYREEILNHLKGHRIEPKFQGVIISSVVGEVTETLCKGLTGFSLGGPILVGAGLDTGLEFSVDRPEELGSDRIVNAVAACELFKGPSLVVDFGTATTITACNKRKLIGGAILPGLGLMAKALHQGTSKLPLVEIGNGSSSIRGPLRAAGRNTIECISSGIIYGTVGAVERLVQEMETEEACRFKIVMTGGYARYITPLFRRECVLDTDLTLKGLRLLFERNR